MQLTNRSGSGTARLHVVMDLAVMLCIASHVLGYDASFVTLLKPVVTQQRERERGKNPTQRDRRLGAFTEKMNKYNRTIKNRKGE